MRFKQCFSRANSKRFLVMCAFAMLFSGCKRKEAQLYPVGGQVLLEGRPLPQAQVILVPAQDEKKELPRPSATTDAQGRFALSTRSPGDGALEGDYVVVVEHRPRIVENGESAFGANWLPPRYSDPAVSELRARVTSGPNDLPLQLRRR